MSEMKHLNQVWQSLYEREEVPSELAEAVLYSLEAGGKRIRPLLFLSALTGFHVTLTAAHYQVAAAIEMIHTGSLIHDDLPAMDNDTLRRGKPTNHVIFGEAPAILAGDALFLDPYYILATCELPATLTVRLVRELAVASGSLGMVAGQVLDMASEGKGLTLAEIERLHQLKTGRMLTFPLVAAGILAGRPDDEVDQLRLIGQRLGLAFQIRDDILDVTATREELGKTPGKDNLEGKSTYVTLLGLERAKKALASSLTAVKKELSELTGCDGTEIFKIIEKLDIK